ncbi:hypothetical protein AGMMS49975_20200 [Clostridia bacterium]|nr:hypothetical protein AGMMS49975_20200 [Clostridia bacterium]
MEYLNLTIGDKSYTSNPIDFETFMQLDDKLAVAREQNANYRRVFDDIVRYAFRAVLDKKQFDSIEPKDRLKLGEQIYNLFNEFINSGKNEERPPTEKTGV